MSVNVVVVHHPLVFIDSTNSIDNTSITVLVIQLSIQQSGL